ncbi:MAG: DDE-type integrase/transposase/recombinase [Clostridia bacterium]
MQNFIIALLLFIIIFLILYIIFKLKWFFIKRKFYQLLPRKNKCINKPYAKFKAFEGVPIIKNNIIKDYHIFLDEYFTLHGKTLKKVNSSKPISKNVTCPFCNAPYQYIYDNNGGKGQYLCKVCSNTFKSATKQQLDTDYFCPHCNFKLTILHDRSEFVVYKCYNDSCKCYTDNLNALSKKDLELYKKEPSRFSLHYHFRLPKFEFPTLYDSQTNKPIVELSKIRCSYMTLGLILTYRINYGLPARKIASLMYDVHNVKISHTTIITYCNIVAPIAKYFIDNFKYDTSGSYCGDETYVKVKGKWHYLIFFFDSIKKIILSYDVFEKRNTESATIALNNMFSKIIDFTKNILVVTDGNPIYNVAHLIFKINGIDFTLKQVIGLYNRDVTSTVFRPLKQIIERLNRTFKEIYKPTCGYGSIHGATVDAILFTACFNFLRPNKALNYAVPVHVDKIQSTSSMPLKWLHLIECGIFMVEHS